MKGLSFRAKLVLSFAFTALVPLTLILVIVSSMVRARFEQDAADHVADAGEVLEGQLASDGRELGQKLGQLASDFELREQLYRYADPASRRHAQGDLIAWLGRARGERGLALLQLTSPEGVIVASGHESGRFDAPDPETAAIYARYPDRPVLAMERGLRGSALALKSSLMAGEGETGLILTGGVIVDERFLARLGIRRGDALVLALPDGSVLVSDNEEARAVRQLLAGEHGPADTAARLGDAGYLMKPLGLGDVAAAEPVSVYLATSTRPLRELLADLNRTFAVLAAAGVGLAWLSGLIMARPVSAEVDRLVEALERVASGELETRVEVRRSDELGQLASAFNAMTRDLAENKRKLLAAERVAAWQEIARRLAHEIKNPLSPIQLSIETLRKCYRTGHASFGQILEESTATILEEVQRLRRIVQEFSDFARLPKPRMSEQDLNELVHGVTSLYGGLDERYRIETDLEPAEARFVFDPDQLHLVLVNLVKNAIEAMPEGGAIAIRTRRAPGGFELRVADTGPGLSQAARARLFEPYATSKPGGTGLGLAIVHRIVKEHGGEITLAEGAGGAAFSIRLPA